MNGTEEGNGEEEASDGPERHPLDYQSPPPPRSRKPTSLLARILAAIGSAIFLGLSITWYASSMHRAEWMFMPAALMSAIGFVLFAIAAYRR
jgi:hypothetical protein